MSRAASACPCRVGHRAAGGGAAPIGAPPEIGSRAQELALIDEIAQVMRDASICGLGQTAAAAVQSAVQRLHLFDPEGASA